MLHFTRHAPCDRVTRPTPRHPASNRHACDSTASRFTRERASRFPNSSSVSTRTYTSRSFFVPRANDSRSTADEWKTRQHGGDRCIDDVAGGTAKRQTFDDRVHAYRRARACKAIEQRMIQFVRPMSLSGGTPCHGVRRARAQIGFDLTPRVLPRITH